MARVRAGGGLLPRDGGRYIAVPLLFQRDGDVPAPATFSSLALA